ncbi:peptidase M76 family protein [Nitzschia inconspicua]|uniref:Mitochondrial inner membrane protease ATP23 n=1 Tax=Nitzschia inconspicua TaxID=303405 RepID=A0A9K3Q772_9STRA|nr:peptidase M76 family protein [Nitzschia inconspicua]
MGIRATSSRSSTSTTAAAETATLPGATDAQIANCDGYVTSALTSNTTVQFLLQRLESMGCTPPAGFITCQNCEGKPVSGGFGMLHDDKEEENQQKQNSTHSKNNSPNVTAASSTSPPKRRPDCTRSAADILDKFQKDKDGTAHLSLKPEIYLCAEHVTGPKHAHTILAHELIHAIDLCRSTMDPLRNCMQLACTEIRAENLSGECNMSWELLRAKLDSYMGHGQQCVRRRTIDSVAANPNCADKASLYVDAAMERCYADTFPFERHPNQR